MRRRLLNQEQGDPAAEAIASMEAKRLGDVARLHFQQPEIISRRDRERITEEVRDSDPEHMAFMQRRQNGGAGASFQGRSGLSSQPGALPPSPAAPRPKLSLRGRNG